MADAATIPSSAATGEETPTGPPIPTSPVIPGSEVQKQTATRTIAPPDLKSSTLSKVMDSIAVIGTSFGDTLHHTGAGLKMAEALRSIQDDVTSRNTMGYIVRLNTLAMKDPSKASDAMADLSDFVGANAGRLPQHIQVVAQQSLQNMKQLAIQEGMRNTIKTFSGLPNVDQRQKDALDFAQMLMPSGMPPGEAFRIGIEYAKTRPESASTTHYEQDKFGRGVYALPLRVDPSKPFANQVTFYQVNQNGMGQGMPMPTTTSEIYSQSKYYDRAAQELGNPLAGQMATDLSSGKPNSGAQHTQTLERARAMELRDQEIERAKGQRQKLTLDQLAEVQSPAFKGTFPTIQKPQFVEDLDAAPGAVKWIRDRVEAHKDERELQTKTIASIATELGKPDTALYDPKTGKPVTGDKILLAQRLKAGEIVDVGKDNAAKIVATEQLDRDFRMAQYLIGQVRLTNGNSSTMNLKKAVDLWVQRKTGTGESAESRLLLGVMNTATLQMAKLLTNNGRFAYQMMNDIKESFPYSDVLSVEASEKMLQWNINQAAASKQLFMKQPVEPLNPQEFYAVYGPGVNKPQTTETGSLGGRPIRFIGK